MIVGKWLYMSPETTMNNQVDHRSDLFSLGVILYLLCSGYMPFTGREPKEIVRKMRAGQYKPLQEVVAVPDRLAILVGRLLSANPDQRPQAGQEVANELAEIARQYGFETSGGSIAYILKSLFPDEVGGVTEHPVPAVIGPLDSKAAASLTPLSPTLQSGASQVYVNTASIPLAPGSRSREYSVSVPLPAATSLTRTTTHTLVPRPLTAPRVYPVVSSQRQASLARVLIIVAVALLLAVGMYLVVRPT